MKRVFLFILLLLVIEGPVFAMGETPPVTSEVVAPEIEFVRSIGKTGSGNGQFLYPQDVSVGVYGDLTTGIGNIFVTDSGNNRVQVFNSEGDYLFQFGRFGNTEGKFNSPAGIYVDFNFRVYVVDQENNRIQKFDTRGNYLGEFGSFGKGKQEK